VQLGWNALSTTSAWRWAAGLAQVLPSGLTRAFAIRAAVPIAWPGIYHLGGFARWRLRRRTPGLPPFSSMKSTPATSSARLSTARVA